ncbi:MAG: MFS transporter [Chloroflexi bacterium]|nr:MFS transporter [Chloroflexota bacterium]
MRSTKSVRELNQPQPTKLLNRNFLLLWQGQAISLLGSQGFIVATLFWIKHTTGSATIMGLLAMAELLPVLILGPIGGTFADRHSRRKILVICDLLSGFAVLALAGLTYFAPEATEVTLVSIVAVSILVSTLGTFFGPAISAATPDLVPRSKLAGANSLEQFSQQLAVFIGQGLGGMLFRLLGAPLLFLIDGLTYHFAAFSESLITIPQVARKSSSSRMEKLAEFTRDTADGFRHVWNTPGLRELVLASSMLSFFAVPVILLLPFYVEDFLKVTVDWYGFLMAAYGVGALAGYILAGSLRLSGTLRCRLMLAAMICQSTGYALLGFVNDTGIVLALAFAGGFLGGFFTVNLTTILQVTTSSEIRGRVFGLLGTISGAITPVAMGLAGIITDMVGQNIPLIYASCGIMMGLLGVLISLNGAFRAFLAYEGNGAAENIGGQPASVE